MNCIKCKHKKDQHTKAGLCKAWLIKNDYAFVSCKCQSYTGKSYPKNKGSVKNGNISQL